MKHNNEYWQRLWRDLARTASHEILCEEARVLMARSADLRHTPQQSQENLPELWQHTYYCTECRTEHAMIMSLSPLLEQDSPATATTPPRPSLPTNDSRSQLQNVIDLLFAGFRPKLATTRSANDQYEHEVVQLEGSQISATLSVDVNEDDPSQRDLFCTLLVDEGELPEGIIVALLSAESTSPLQQQTPDQFGDVMFEELKPTASYRLKISVQKRVYFINKIKLP